MMSRFAVWGLGAGLMLGPLGCGEESFPSVEAGKLRLFEDEFRMGPTRETHLFVVEGSEDATAAELRRRFARDFVEAEAYRWDGCRCTGRSWRPLHRIGVFAFPTKEGPVLLGPESSSEDLVQATNSVECEQITRWSEAVAERIIAPPPEGTNAVLASLEDATALFTGARAANTAEERALVELLVPRPRRIQRLPVRASEASSRPRSQTSVRCGSSKAARSSLVRRTWTVPSVSQGFALRNCPKSRGDAAKGVSRGRASSRLPGRSPRRFAFAWFARKTRTSDRA